MEILTLLRAAIRHRKGSFLSIALLVVIITAVTVSVLSVRMNFRTAIDSAYEYTDTPELCILINDKPELDELLKKLDNCQAADHYEISDIICNTKMHINNGTDIDHFKYFTTPEDNIMVLNDDFTGFKDEVPELKKGEVLIPYGLQITYKLKRGDTITIEEAGRQYSFTILDFFEEPLFGSINIGLKKMYMSFDDFSEITENSRAFDEALANEADHPQPYDFVNGKQINIYSSDPDMSGSELMRRIELDTGLISSSMLPINKEDSRRYTEVTMKMVTSIVLIFLSLLFVIVLIVIGHSIRVELKIDYKNMGILKAQGITERKLTLVIMLRYMMAEATGIVIGVLCAIPLGVIMGDLFGSLTAIIPDHNIALKKSIIIIMTMLLMTITLIFLCTRDLSRISPVKAIHGNHSDFYYDSIINLPITKHFLSFSLNIRNITSSKKRYIGLSFIISILTFFMVNINIINQTMNSRTILDHAGIRLADIDIIIKNSQGFDELEEAEEIIRNYTDIEQKLTYMNKYVTINGYNIGCESYEDPEQIIGMLKGRRPIYDNEAILTQMAGETYGIKIGDEVTISYNGRSAEYLITGFHQNTFDAGMSCAMSAEGGKRIGIGRCFYNSYYIKDNSKINIISDIISQKYEQDMNIYVTDYSKGIMISDSDTAILLSETLIYFFSIVFVIITMLMISRRTFIQERHDIGIYKAMGFTNARLRLNYSLRFLFVAVIGGLLGSVLSLIFSEKLLNMMFRMLGIYRISPAFTANAFVSAIFAICTSVMLFSYIESRKIKSVSIRELIIE